MKNDESRPFPSPSRANFSSKIEKLAEKNPSSYFILFFINRNNFIVMNTILSINSNSK